MNSISLIDIDTPVGASYVYINGQIKLNQRSPLSSGTIAKTIYYTDLFVNSTAPVDFMSIYKDYMSRNLTTPIVFDKLVMPYKSNTETVIEVDITVPYYQDVK
jgi:hypothetical protein